MPRFRECPPSKQEPPAPLTQIPIEITFSHSIRLKAARTGCHGSRGIIRVSVLFQAIIMQLNSWELAHPGFTVGKEITPVVKVHWDFGTFVQSYP